LADYENESTEEEDNSDHKDKENDNRSADGFFAISYLQDKAFVYRIKITDIDKVVTDNNVFTLDRYSQKVFQRIISNTDTTANSTAGYSQFLALRREDPSVVLDLRGANKIKIRFKIDDPLSSLKIVNLQTSFG